MKYIELTKAIQKPYFTRRELVLRGISAYDAQLTLWQQNGLLERVKRGIYVFADRKKDVALEEVSAFLYEPSYISLESALSVYGLIPEIVPAKTAVTTKATRTFSNAFGHFIYRNLKPELFFGYVPHTTKHGKFLLAEPEKALLDYLYLNRQRMNSAASIEELRINCEMLSSTVDRKKLERYLAAFHSKKLEKIVGGLFALCSPTHN